MFTPTQRLVRLIAQGRLSNAVISTQTGFAVNTVKNWRTGMDDLGLGLPELDGLGDRELQEMVTPGRFIRKRKFEAPDFERAIREKTRRKVNYILSYEEYCNSVAPTGVAMSRATYYRLKGEAAAAKDIELRFVYAPGEMIQFDYIGIKLKRLPKLIGPDGKPQRYELACGVSAYSRKIYAEATPDQTQSEFFATATRMFHFYGGVPVLLTTDNFPAVIQKPRRGSKDEVPTAAYQAFADHYQFGIIATRVRAPRDKGLGEGTVRIVQERIMARLRDRIFFSLAELNAAIAALLAELNARPMKDHGNLSRNDLFEEDWEGLVSLPATDYEHGKWLLRVRAGRDYLVPVFGSRYSVSSQYAGDHFDAKVTRTSVHLYRQGKLVRTHLKASGPGQIVVDPADMPESHKAAVADRLVGVKARVKILGLQAEEFIERHYRKSRRPKQTLEAADRLLFLAKSYGDERVGAACAKAISLGISSVVKIESMLQAGVEKFAPAAPAMPPARPPSGNVRGRAYFEEELRKGGRPDV